jgi:CubicO group peptidase (beta-lactamase class C family)
MKVHRKWILYSAVILVIMFIAGAGYFVGQIALLGAAYKAKSLCSGIFISQRDLNSILTQDDFADDDLSMLRHFATVVDYQAQTVTASLLGVFERKAAYRPSLGCTLVIGISQDKLFSLVNVALVPSRNNPSDLFWPKGERVDTESLPDAVDSTRLSQAMDWAFSDPDPNRLRRTRAAVVVYDGRIIAERYAPGFSSNTPLIGWSMTKSIINALIGILIQEGKLSLQDRALIPEWRKPGDTRASITVENLLHMTSGLAFSEDPSNPLGDVIQMLLDKGDTAAYASKKPLQAKPGAKWHYSSGNTNILARIIRTSLGGTDTDYLTFARRALFDRIGMSTAVIEADAAGTLVGSSFMYATARDWARFGLLYLQDGVWMGQRILPKDWVDYSHTPAAVAPEGKYGAHFWLNVPEPYTSGAKEPITLPPDIFHAAGHDGQFVTIIPSRKLVIVRLGLTRLPHIWDHASFITKILEATSG